MLGAVSALAAPLVTGQLTQAGAADEYSPCSSAAIEQAIFNATGEHTGQMSSAGLACNPFLYNKGQWSNQAELEGYVNEVLGRCGANNKFLVLALLETTGQPPQAGVPGSDNVCDRSIYEQWWNDTSTMATRTVDWTKYNGGAYPSLDVYGAVHGTMSVCHRSEISHAVVSVTDRYPVTDPDGTNPNLYFPNALGARGQCDPGLYRNGVWTSYGDLKQRVAARATSTVTCGDTAISTAYVQVTGWRPLLEECEITRYGNGSWATYQELVNRIYHSLRCSEPWLGQFYAFDIAQKRRVSGRGWSVGECSTLLYRPQGGIFLGYDDFRQKVQAATGQLAQQGVEIDSSGDLTIGGTEYDASQVLVGSTTGQQFAGTLGGQVYESSSGGLVQLLPKPGDGIISTGGGNVIAPGGGNVVAPGGGNIIATGGGNVVAAGGGN